MDARKQQGNYKNEYYMDGNTARKLQVVPRYPEEEELQPRQQPVRKIRKRPRVNEGIDMFSLFVLTVAIVVTLYTCVEFLGVQSNLTEMNTEIADLESSLTKLQNENTDALSQLNTFLDLNYIYQVATNELGMVYPNENQVITYESNLSDYVRQYDDIPEERTTLLDGILR